VISRRLVLGALIALAAAGEVAAQSLDPSSQDALNKTLQILLDPAARNAGLAKDPQGAAIDQQVRALAGSDTLTQEFYALAGQILTELAQNTGGDAQKMLQAVERAKTDPAGFAAMLSPATLQRLRDLSIKLSDKQR
jgi:phage-related minor tail protein